MKRVIAWPANTKDNPLPFEEALKQAAPKTLTRIIELHLEDGTPCYLPYCNEEHDTYEITYTRTSVKKEVKT